MGLGDGTRMDGRSSLDEPTGTRKYSMAAPSAGDRAAKRERKTNDMIDRNLQRAMRNGTPQQRVAAGVAYQERSSRPGYQQGGGIQSAEGNRNRDRETADNFTKEGLRLKGKEDSADVVAGQADAANKNVGVATADGGKNSKIGTSKADASGRPPVTGQFEPGSDLERAERDLWSKDPKPDGIGSPDKDGNITMTMDFRDSDKNGVDDKEDWLKRNPDYFNTGKGASAAPAVGAGGSPTPPAGQGSTAPATTPPVAQGGAGKGKPPVPDWRDERKNQIEEQVNNFKRKKLGEDLLELGRAPVDVNRKNPEEQLSGTPNDEFYAYGESLGITKDQMLKQIDKGAATKKKSKYEPSKETLDMESKFDAMIADRPADQKAMFAKMSDEDKAAMVQKNESLKTIREETAKLGPDKNSNAEQAKALIPGAKKELQGFIDAADIMTGSTQDAFGDFEAKAESLREKRGAAEWRGTMDSFVSGAASIQGQDEPTVIPSGNPLFGDSPDAEALYKQTASNKPTSTKTPETGEPVNATKDSPTIGFGGKATKRAWDNYGNSGTFGGGRGDPGTPWWESIGKAFSDANTPPTQKGESGFPSAPQASNTPRGYDNKLQQHHDSIDASKDVLQGARKITDDIWGSSYAAV